MERLPNFPPLMNVLKRVFFDGAYIEKWGMVFWGESNKEERIFLFFYFFYSGRNIPFIYYLLTYLLTYSFYHVFSHISSFLLLIMNLPYADSNPSGRYGLVCVS